MIAYGQLQGVQISVEAARPQASVLASSQDGWHAKGPAKNIAECPGRLRGGSSHSPLCGWVWGLGTGWQELPELALLSGAEGPGSSEAECWWGTEQTLLKPGRLLSRS